jgi:hypothetical protein
VPDAVVPRHIASLPHYNGLFIDNRENETFLGPVRAVGEAMRVTQYNGPNRDAVLPRTEFPLFFLRIKQEISKPK